jgi:uncharacterized membrane protein YjjP (DUF1212 family)
MKKSPKQPQFHNQKKKTLNNLNNFAKYSSLPMQMMIIILAGVFAGIKLDKWLVWKFPLFTFILSILGITIAIYIAVKDFLKK